MDIIHVMELTKSQEKSTSQSTQLHLVVESVLSLWVSLSLFLGIC